MQYALQRAGLRELPEAKYVQVPTHSRRHATFHVGRDGKLGFYAPRSHQVIELTSCEVLSVKLFAAYQFCAAHFATIEIDRIGLTEYPQGVDVDLYCSARPTQIDKWRILAEQQGLLRLNVVTQDKFETTTSELPPPGSFVQATFAGEEAIQAAIKAAVGERPEQAIVDFYAGLGNSTLALTELGHSVLAFEGDAAMVGYLEKIHPGTFQRDLVKSPWPAAKLRHTDVALVNPPYNGALPQTEEIAAAKVPTVVMISCNPVTLERDLKALVLAGYKVSAVTLIDQFLWSMHIEAVVVCRLQR